MTITLVVARARNGVIGRGNALPWRLPPDLAHFKRTTMGGTLVMGRRTWQSIGRALPGRRSVVVTRDPSFRAEGADVVASLDAALALPGPLFVVGGAELFAAALPRVDRAVVTEIDRDYDGDTFFAPLDPREWVETSREAHVETDDAPAYAFVHHARRPRSAT